MPLRTHEHDRKPMGMDGTASITSKSPERQGLGEVALPQNTFQIFELLGFEDLMGTMSVCLLLYTG
jgi:hypothetical protein